MLELSKNEQNSTQGPSHEDLVRQLVRSMEEQGLEIEAAELYGRAKPKPVKVGLRPGRSRPDVVARDGRRTVFGLALLPSDISAAHMPEKVATLAQKCRLLVIVVSEDAVQQALDTLFNRERLAHRPKMRLLRHPALKWEDPPKTTAPQRYGPDFAHVVVRK
jgi:hypothetical protein